MGCQQWAGHCGWAGKWAGHCIWAVSSEQVIVDELGSKQVIADELAAVRGTWRNGYSVALCQCRCLSCGFEYRLVRDFQRNIMFLPSQSWDIVRMVCPWARHFTLKCFTWLRWKWVPCRQRWQFNAPKRLQDCMLPGELKWHMNEQVQWPEGNM